MKVICQEFFVVDKLHAQGLLDFLAAYFMAVQEDILDINYGLLPTEQDMLELNFQLDVDDKGVTLVLEMLAELIDQMPPEFVNVVQLGDYRIIHGSTPLENHLLSELQLLSNQTYHLETTVERLQYDMQAFKDVYKNILDEVRALKVYNHHLMSPKSLNQVLEQICEELEAPEIMEELIPVSLH